MAYGVKRGIGDYAQASIRVTELAETLQAIALDGIRDQFKASQGLDFERGVSYADYVKALTEAEEAGTRDEFEAYLAEKMGSSWTSFQQMQAAKAAEQGATNG